MQNAMRVLIADDRSRSRHGLRALLATQPGIEVVGEAGDGREALRLVEERNPAQYARSASRLSQETRP